MSNCSNPECNKSYHVENNEPDDGFCSFECWEKVHCLKPTHIHFEEIQIGV